MNKIKLIFFSFMLIFLTFNCAIGYSSQKILNIFAWGGEIPQNLIDEFERTEKIKVNFSSFESNETLLAKLDSSNDYDVILPSSNIVDRLRKEGKLQILPKSKIPHLTNINPVFSGRNYDPESNYSVPFIWGATGLFINHNSSLPTPKKWNDLWQDEYKGKLLLLDDPREVFSIALISLGYSINDRSPLHIKQAYEKLKLLLPNIKLFSTNTVKSVVLDEDAKVGMIWNGDFFKVSQELTGIDFIYPKEGFLIWVDCFAVLKQASHKNSAYKFINFMLKSESGSKASVSSGFATANQSAYQQLPTKLKHSPLIYPSKEVAKRGETLTYIGNKANTNIIKYWQKLKLLL